MSDTALDIWIPEGYLEMPLSGIQERLRVVQQLVAGLPSSELTATANAILPTVTTLLGALAQRDARYCGVGRHLSSTGDLVTSCLTVCVLETEGEQCNPRLTLTNLVESRIAAGDEQGEVEVTDIDGIPMLFSERTIRLPTPDLPGRPYAGDSTATYQLEAIVPAADGSATAAIEMSTSYVDHGPEFRKMIVDMARSVGFRPSDHPPVRPSSLDL
ncbi:hypothetical protein F5X71_05395 [Nocardia brasiliensis]|uniref:Uncharacterized protein n=1 Tax=Nocardia brasiliensis TaxID=37326 RepID=A0A6G9XLN8_NOCBR|nr:hypothetical protein [Nocardia brasiliensis]QIS01825.1 hypothetical protein F5X71_05395 [Nocardia brasiliensis]